jgi:hypothetical protein
MINTGSYNAPPTYYDYYSGTYYDGRFIIRPKKEKGDRAKCPACGQWGEVQHQCIYCGHPIDGEYNGTN